MKINFDTLTISIKINYKSVSLIVVIDNNAGVAAALVDIKSI